MIRLPAADPLARLPLIPRERAEAESARRGRERAETLGAALRAAGSANERRRYRPRFARTRPAGGVLWTALPDDAPGGVRAFEARILSPSYTLRGPVPGGWALERQRFNPGPPVALGRHPTWRLACRAAELDAGLRPGCRHRFSVREARP